MGVVTIRKISLFVGSLILLLGCTSVLVVSVDSDTVSGDPGPQIESSADPFERFLPYNYNDYRFLGRFVETFEYHGLVIPPLVSFVEYDGMSYWAETDSNGNRVAQLVNIGQVNEGDVVRVPKSIVHDGESYAVVSVGICFQPLSMYDSKTNDYLTHVGICGNSVEIPKAIDERGYLTWSEPTHYSIVFEGRVKVQDLAFCEFDVFHGTTGQPHYYFTKSGITSVTFEEGVSSIGQWAFAYSAIRNITVPDTESVGDYAFYYTEDLISVDWASDANIPDYAFKGPALSEITISGSPKKIGEWAFSSTKITSIDIPDSVTEIGEHAFHFCGELASVSLGTGLTTIPTACFNSCVKLTDLSVAGSITEVESGAFSKGPSLSSFDFSNVERIGDLAFERALIGNDLIILDLSNVKRIGDKAFRECTAPVELILSSELESVGTAALLGLNIVNGDISVSDGCTLAESAFFVFDP